MAKEVVKVIKLQIKAGAANPSPPVGPALATSPPSSNGGGDARGEGVLGGELRDGAACFWLIGPNGKPGAALDLLAPAGIKAPSWLGRASALPRAPD